MKEYFQDAGYQMMNRDPREIETTQEAFSLLPVYCLSNFLATAEGGETEAGPRGISQL